MSVKTIYLEITWRYQAQINNKHSDLWFIKNRKIKLTTYEHFDPKILLHFVWNWMPVNMKAYRGEAAQSVTVKPTGCGFEEMKYLLKFIFFSSLWCRGKARRWDLSLNTQCIQNPAESGERSVLILDSICLPCYVRDTAWSWFSFFLNV